MIFEGIFTICVIRTLLCVFYTSVLSSFLDCSYRTKLLRLGSLMINKLYNKQAFFLHYLLGNLTTNMLRIEDYKLHHLELRPFLLKMSKSYLSP